MMQNKMQNIMNEILLETPLGTMLAIANNSHLYVLTFADQNNIQQLRKSVQNYTSLPIQPGVNPILQQLEYELAQYFAGTLQQFSIPLHPVGTPFRKLAWQVLLKIPYGTMTSYLQQAAVVGNPRAFRAVASANKNNPIAIIQPCHRVIKSNGNLCGYNSGLHRKEALLKLESRHLQSI